MAQENMQNAGRYTHTDTTRDAGGSQDALLESEASIARTEATVGSIHEMSES